MITNYKLADNTDIGSLFCNITLDQTINGSKSFSKVPIVGTVIQSDNSDSAASTKYVTTAFNLLSAEVSALRASYNMQLNALKTELIDLKALYLLEINNTKITVERNLVGNCPGCYLAHRHTTVPFFYSVPDMKVYAYSDDDANIIDYIIIMPGYRVQPYVGENYTGDSINPIFYDCTYLTKPIIRYFTVASSTRTRSFKLYYKEVEVEVISYDNAAYRNYIGG